jgi:hypothetical protein
MRQLLFKLNNGFPIIELTVVLYILQYLVAPLFEYNYNPEQSMAVGKEEYLEFTLLVVLAFAFGLLSLKSTFNLKFLTIDSALASKLGRALIIIGFSSQLAMNLLPEALRATLNFFILFKIIGVYALIFSNVKLDKLLILLFSLQIAIGAILGAMLIDLIIFALFFIMFYSVKSKVTNKIKYSFFIIGFVFLSVYQGIKAEYRELVWYQEQELTVEHQVALLGTLVSIESFQSAFSFNVEKNESLRQTMNRLNQGWQTSMVYNHVPKQVPFENGEAFVEDVMSSFMPRFLWSNKRAVNDYQRFNYYTGYSLNKGTAMSMGVIGDFYLNFGKTGTVIMIFLFGYFIARIKRYFMEQFVYPNPINLIWIPFIFSFLIRPGNEFYMVLNHLFKASIVLFVVFKFIYPWLGISNRPPTKGSFEE